MNHDCTREIDAAVRKATAALHEIIADLRADRDLASATITELHEQIGRLTGEREAARLSVMKAHAEIDRMEREGRFVKASVIHDELRRERDTAVAECIELRDHLSQANAALAEMTRCRTAADVQHVIERNRGETWQRFSRSDLIA
jgi:uncharacterized coiled-coil DUF342 family protein